MEWKRIVAIIRKTTLETVEQRLRQIGVRGITVSPVKGYGEYANLCKNDWLVSNARIEIYAESAAVDAIVAALLETAQSGSEGDGLVAVMPVERLYRIRTGQPMSHNDI